MENTVITQFNIAKCNYKWVIKDCMFTYNKPLSSPIFSAIGYDWKIEITLYLCHYTSHVEIKLIPEKIIESQKEVKLRLSLLINENEEISRTSLHRFTTPYTLVGDKSINSKIKNTVLSDKNHVTIICSLMAYSDSAIQINEQNNTIFEQANNDLSKDLSKLLEDKTYCDITLVTEEKEFTAHKAVLVARSPVFYTMFKTDMIEKKKNRVDIKNVKPNVLSAMLSYIYSQKVENINEIDVELLEVAERFDIKGLKILCSGALLKKMSVQNVAETFIWADLHNAAYLKTEALSFIVLNKNEVLNTEGFKILMKSHPNLGMELFGKI